MTADLKSKDLFHSMFQTSVESILVVSEDGSILMANPACENLFGYESGNLTGKDIGILISEKLKRQFKKQIRKGIKAPVEPTDLLGIKKDGSQFNLEISFSPTLIEGKNVTSAFLRNVSKHKEDLQQIEQTNKALVESNRKFDTLVNNVKGVLFRCKNNSDYEMDYISEGCLEITGHSSEAFKNQTITYGQLILDEDRDTVWEHIQSAVKKKKQYDFECRIQHKDGSIKYVWEKGEAVYNDQNEVVALEGFITDVTAQKELELSLKENQVKTKALLEAIPDMMLIQDRKGDYLDWYANNPEKFSLPPEKFIGVNMKKLMPQNVYQKIKSSHNKAIKSGKMQIAEYSVQGKTGIEYREARVVLMQDHNLLTIVRDLTEGKDTDAQLNIRNNALASASNSIIIADAEQLHTPIIYCNGAFEKMTGYTEEEVLGRNSQFLQNDDRDQKEIGIMKDAIADGEACNVIVRNYRKDGTLFWNDVTITPIYNEEKKLTHFIGVHNDITNKIKEENLKDQTRKILELITRNQPIETIGNAIVEIVETHIKDFTASVSRLTKEDKTLHKVAAPNLPNAVYDYFESAAIVTQAGSYGTASFLKKEVIISNIETGILSEEYNDIALINGLKTCWSFPVMSSTNEVIGTFNVYGPHQREPLTTEKEIILDLTHLASIAIENHNNIIALQKNKRDLELYSKKLEEKVEERTHEVMTTVQKLVETNLNLEDQLLITEKAEKVALASKALISKIARYFPKGLIVVINRDLKVELVEGEVLDLLDLRQTIYEGLSMHDLNLFSKQRKLLIKENILKTLSGQHLSFETKFKKSYFSINTMPLYDENNEVVSALHVYNDISSQKEIEFSFHNAFIKEKELNDLKSRFVSMASHEFRTPLSAILTSAILIGKQNEPGKEHKREKYVAQIERNVNHLVVILNDFLSLSKLEEGKVVATQESFDLIQFSKALVKEINLGLKKGQTIKMSKDVETLLVYLDTKLLRHVLMNLLSNASKYSSEGSNVDLNISTNQKTVLIQIADQGIGIPEEEQAYLFQRFFRANNAAKIEGTGLGLNIVKSYTILMDGDIGFTSELNKGTTFWVEFPINEI